MSVYIGYIFQVMLMLGVLYEWNMWYDPIHQLVTSGPVLSTVYIAVHTRWVCSICYVDVCILCTFLLVSAMQALYMLLLCVCVCICLSVTPDIVSKRLNRGSCEQCHMIT